MHTKRIIVPSLALILVLYAAPARALPIDGKVVGGSATISQPNGQTLNINQLSDKAIINWKGFNINVNELVKFTQPSSASIALNRVTGIDPSSILGKLIANGRIFIVNPNGVFFGPNSVVDVAGLLATTLNIKDSDFMAGKFNFAQDPAKNLSYVINQGQIKVSDNGFVFLVAPGVTNDGLVIANLGKVVMGSGERLTVDFMGDGLITFAVEGKVLDKVKGPDGTPLTSAVSNAGSIKADGGQVILTARASSEIFSSVVNNSGVIEARSLVNRGGVIRLEASDPVANTGEIGWQANLGKVKNAEGAVINTGTLDVSAAEPGAAQGEVTLSGQMVGSSGAILAKGADGAQGGRVLISSPDKTVLTTGSVIDTSGVGNSSAGRVVVWSDKDTIFRGNILAKGGALGGNGGNVEVSGHENLGFYGLVDASARYGRAGTLLLDPKNIIVANGGSDTLSTNDEFAENSFSTRTFDADTIAEVTNTGTAVTLQANNDITINEAITTNNLIGSGGALTFQAGRSILINANLTTDNALLTITANETEANGVISSSGRREAGAAAITMADGTTLNAGNANIVITMSTGDGRTSGNITLENLTTTGHVLVVNNGPTAGSSILRTSADGLITASSGAFDLNGAGGGGSIGTSAAPIRVTVTNLEARGQSGGLFIESPTQGLNLGGATLGGLTGISISSGGEFQVTARGSITDSETLTGSTLTAKTLSDSGAAITLDTSTNDFTTVNLLARNAADSANAAGAITYRDAGGFDVAAAQTTGTVTLTGGGAITDSGTLTGSTLTVKTLSNAGAAITLDTATNDFTTVDLRARNAADTIDASGAITYLDATSFAVDQVRTTGTTALTAAAGAITDGNGAANNITAATANLTAGTNIATSGDPLGTTVGTLNATANAGGVFITEADAVTLGTVTATGAGNDVVVTNTTGDMTVETVTAANVVTLTSTAGAILDGNAGANNITATSLSATAATGIDTDTTITTLTLANVTGTGNIDISDTAGGLAVTSATTTDGNITLNATGGDLVITTVTAAGAGADVTLSTTTSGNITLGVVTAPDQVTLTGAGAITDTNAGAANVVATSLSATAATGIDTDTTITTLTLANVTGTGNIDISDTAGGLAVTSATTTNGNITLNSTSGDLTLTTVTAGGSGDATLTTTTSGSVVLGSVTATGNDVTVNSVGQINDDVNDALADITAATASLTAATGIGVVNGSVDLSVPTVTLATTNTGGINLNSLGAATFTDINATGAGNITVAGTGNTTFTSVSSFDGSVTLSVDSGNLTATTVTVGGSGDAALTTTNSGNINAGNVTAAGDTVTLTAAGAIEESGADAAADITASTIDLNAATGIGGAAQLEISGANLTVDTTNGNIDVDNLATTPTTVSTLTTGTGNISFDQTGGQTLALTTATTTAGNITLSNDGAGLTVTTVIAAGTGADVSLTTTTSGNISLGVVTAPDQVTLTSAGTITDTNAASNNITAANLAMTAAAGIGTAIDPLETTVSNLEASGGTGGLFVTNSSALIIGGVSGALTGVSATGSDIILTSGPLTVNEAVSNTGGGNTTLTSVNDGGNDDHLTINAQVTTSGGSGNLTLNAGTDLIVNDSALSPDISVAGAGTITANVQRDLSVNANVDVESAGGTIALNFGQAGTGGTLTLKGAVTGGTVNATGGAGSDTFIGPDIANTWNTTGANSGNLTNADGTIAFTSVENLTGGTSTDNFVFSDTATISGSIDGRAGIDTIDWSAYSTARSVTLTGLGSTDGFAGTEASIAGGFDNINALVGSATATTDSLTVNGTATLLLGAGQVTQGAATTNYSQFENLTATTAAGGINVDGVNVAGTVTLTAAGAINSVTNDGTADITAGTINLTANAGGIGTTSPVDVTASVALNADTSADSSNIFIDGIGNLPLGVVTAASGNVTLNSTVAIADGNAAANNITAGTVNLTAGTNIAVSGDLVETTIGTLNATANAGGIFIAEANAVTLGTVTATGAGNDVVISNATGDMTVGTVTAPDQVTLTSTAGAIVDGNDPPAGTNNITATTLVATAASGIGTASNPVEVTVSNLTTTGGTGGVFITNTTASTSGIGINIEDLQRATSDLDPERVNEDGFFTEMLLNVLGEPFSLPQPDNCDVDERLRLILGVDKCQE